MMNRQEAVAALTEILDNAIVVTGLGNVALDLFVAAERPLNFYTSGAMGTAISIAFGLAVARPDRKVICLEGDGSLLMNLGCLATIGKYQPANLTCLIFDNELYQITGGQPTHTGATTDLAAVARGCGVEQAAAVSTHLELRNELARTVDRSGPHIVVAKVDTQLANGFLPRKGILYKYRLMHALGTAPDTDTIVWS
jgi:thiamine pyrophosphate-dependent acetolactate synthase large subunit-like protein